MHPTAGHAIFKTDGTEAGVVLVDDVRAFRLTALGNRVYFNADDGTGAKLWASDGTPAGTVVVPGQPSHDRTDPIALAVCGGRLFASMDSGPWGREPFAFSP